MADIITTGTSGYATGSLDTASTVVNNVTATDAVQPNGLAAAVVQIETVLGLGTTLKGSVADLATRLAVSMESSGKLKTSSAANRTTFPLSAAEGGTGTTTNTMPAGAIIAWTTTTAPSGFLLCDGSSLLRATYADLFTAIGTTYGTVDGTHFTLPDLRGRAIIMVDGAANRITAASTNGGNADTIGGVGGTETHTLITAESPAHTHAQAVNTLTFDYGVGSGALAGGSDIVQGSSTGSTGGGGAHSNTQPWIALEYIIKY